MKGGLRAEYHICPFGSQPLYNRSEKCEISGSIFIHEAFLICELFNFSHVMYVKTPDCYYSREWYKSAHVGSAFKLPACSEEERYSLGVKMH